MFTSLQTQRLEKIMSDKPRSIKDLALLSLASRQGHPKMIEWYMTAAYCSKPFVLNNIIALAPKIEFLQFKLYVTHIRDCYYIGERQCFGNVKSLLNILKNSENPEIICRQCLKQVTTVLCHLKDKDIDYVHGNLTTGNIMVENNRFYILDKGFERKKHGTDPYFCYRSRTYDLHTLCLSMRAFFNPGTLFYSFLSGCPTDPKFLPESLKENMSVNAISMYLKGLTAL
jgi:hypothetical protein